MVDLGDAAIQNTTSIEDLLQYCPETVGIPIVYIIFTCFVILMVNMIPYYWLSDSSFIPSLVLLDLIVWWNLFAVAMFSIHEYMMWSLEPSLEDLVECTLLKDLVEMFLPRLGFLLLNMEILNASLEKIDPRWMYLSLFRSFIVLVGVLPIAGFRFILILCSFFALSWPFVYILFVAIMIMLFLKRYYIPFSERVAEVSYSNISGISTISFAAEVAAELEKENAQTSVFEIQKPYFVLFCIVWVGWFAMTYTALCGFYYIQFEESYGVSFSIRSDMRRSLIDFFLADASLYQIVVKYFL